MRSDVVYPENCVLTRADCKLNIATTACEFLICCHVVDDYLICVMSGYSSSISSDFLLILPRCVHF